MACGISLWDAMRPHGGRYEASWRAHSRYEQARACGVPGEKEREEDLNPSLSHSLSPPHSAPPLCPPHLQLLGWGKSREDLNPTISPVT